jgi:hypothetical protein
VQPYCALGIGLKRAGHEVTVAANENFSSFVRQFDLEFAAIALNMQEFLQLKKGQRLIAGEKLSPEEEEKLLRQQLQSAIAACQGTEVIIYTLPSNWGYHIAQKLGVPCFMASAEIEQLQLEYPNLRDFSTEQLRSNLLAVEADTYAELVKAGYLNRELTPFLQQENVEGNDAASNLSR